MDAANKGFYSFHTLIRRQKGNTPISNQCSEIELQPLLDHTALRLYKYVAKVTVTLEAEKQNMFYKARWICGDSHNINKNLKTVSTMKQIFFKTIFFLYHWLLRLMENKTIIRQNPILFSVRFCRLIRIRIINESKDVT